MQPAMMRSAGSRSRASSSGPSRSIQSACDGEQHGGCDGERGRDHRADHHLEATLARLAHESDGARQAAGLVELDVDGIVKTSKPREVGGSVDAFVGADRHRAMAAAQGLVVDRQAAAARSSRCRIRSRPPMRSLQVYPVHASLASTMSRASGRAAGPRAYAHRRPRRRASVSTAADLRTSRSLLRHRVRRIEAQSESRYRRTGSGSPASAATRTPVRLLSKSQRAQSSAFSAAPGFKCCGEFRARRDSRFATSSDFARGRRQPFRRSAHRERLRRGPNCAIADDRRRRRAADVFEPREMVKASLSGQISFWLRRHLGVEMLEHDSCAC